MLRVEVKVGGMRDNKNDKTTMELKTDEIDIIIRGKIFQTKTENRQHQIRNTDCLIKTNNYRELSTKGLSVLLFAAVRKDF